MSATVGVTARDLEEAATAQASAPSTPWARSYADRLAVTDAGAIAVAVASAYAVRIPSSGETVVSGEFSPTYLSVSLVLFGAWFLALTVGRTRDRRLVGAGPAEYARVFEVTWHLFAGVAIVAFVFRMEIGRGYLAIAAPLGLGLVLLGRLLWRRQLHGRRDRGLDRSPVLVVGPLHKVGALIKEFHRNPRAGYEVVGVCVSGVAPPRGHHVQGVPVLGTQDDAARVACERGVAAVAVAGSDAMTGDAARRLAWDLEGSGVDMALTLTLTDVAGPRVLMQPVNGLPLVYVDEPRFTGSKYVVKSLFDWVGALVITAVVSPVLLMVALLVKLTSRGPVFYVQERIGRDGRPFRMLKFRSMVVGAHDQLADVLAAEGINTVSVFYKPKDDPRVTPLGRVLRRYSLDELPQLFNVLRGEMSLVGPRPQIEAEVATYDRAAHRRLLVKPGLTGIWQVSGRSSLDGETSMRMDVAYVENWTLFGDVMILARTARAMVVGDGAR